MSDEPGSVSAVTTQPDGDQGPAEPLEDAKVAATLAAYWNWVAAERPGAVSHEAAMAELLRDW
jgi:hypothetical protein